MFKISYGYLALSKVMSKNVYLCPKAAILKNPELRQFQKLLHWRAHMPKPIPRYQIHPSSFGSFEVMSKNVYFGSEKRPF